MERYLQCSLAQICNGLTLLVKGGLAGVSKPCSKQLCAHSVSRTHAARVRSQVADFGCAREAAAAGVTVEPGRRGALAYQAPEVLERGVLSPAADCYAFGVLLWEMLTAQARPRCQGLDQCVVHA